MHTNVKTVRAETRTIAIAAPPAAVLDVLGDGRRIPEWAPAFAQAAEPEPDGDAWLLTSGGTRFPVVLRVSRAAGTVDIVSPQDDTRGAFLRVLPNAGGAECLFTLFFGDRVEEAAIVAQMETVERELAAIRDLAEAAA